MKKTLLFIIAGYALASCPLLAANISVENAGLSGQNTAQDWAYITFDLSWDASWRMNVGPANHDAAWVFAKYRVNSGSWQHATLNYVDGTVANDGHIIGTNMVEVLGVPEGTGAFMHRSTNGFGSVNWDNLRLRWNYGVDGVGDSDQIEVSVFAIEMVEVPEGAFQLGTGGTERDAFFARPDTTTPYIVTNDGPIVANTDTGALANVLLVNTIEEAVPVGFNSFYCMKYETSEAQFAAFLNSLNALQLLSYTNQPNTNINMSVNPITAAHENGAMEWLSGDDLMAYADWAGLRLMSEFEYEKACRGPGGTPNEYAWGNSSIHSTLYSISNVGTGMETVTNPGVGTGNAHYAATQTVAAEPLRCGIFASSATNPTREETGATFWGIMEMSGSVEEICGSAKDMTAEHGDGALAPNGRTDQYTGLVLKYRGGSYNAPELDLRVSSRRVGFLSSDARLEAFGGRCVRSAP